MSTTSTPTRIAWPPSSEHLRRLPPATLERLARLATPRLTRYVPHQPHPKQAAFLLLGCREAMYGGAADGGKSVALLMGALQYVDRPGYHALVLRRTFQQLSKPGALMDLSKQWLLPTDAHWSA